MCLRNDLNLSNDEIKLRVLAALAVLSQSKDSQSGNFLPLSTVTLMFPSIFLPFWNRKPNNLWRCETGLHSDLVTLKTTLFRVTFRFAKVRKLKFACQLDFLSNQKCRLSEGREDHLTQDTNWTENAEEYHKSAHSADHSSPYFSNYFISSLLRSVTDKTRKLSSFSLKSQSEYTTIYTQV